MYFIYIIIYDHGVGNGGDAHTLLRRPHITPIQTIATNTSNNQIEREHTQIYEYTTSSRS